MARGDYYGVDFTWYAVDADDHVAQFMAGYAPIPTSVFANESLVTQVDAYFENAPQVTDVRLANPARTLAARDASSAAGRGLFVFLETGRQGSPTYRLDAVPAKPLVASTLPPAILLAVTCVRFRVSFADVTILVPPDHVSCST